MKRLVGLTLFLVSTAHAQTYTLLDNSFTASTHFIGVTISGYNVAVHGRGEASLTRALAPVSIK